MNRMMGKVMSTSSGTTYIQSSHLIKQTKINNLTHNLHLSKQQSFGIDVTTMESAG